MEASVPCSVATPNVAEQFRDQAVLPAAYLTPTNRRNEKGDYSFASNFNTLFISLFLISFQFVVDLIYRPNPA